MTSASDARRRPCLAFVLFLALGANANPVRAEGESSDAETRTLARDLAQQGAEAFEKQDYATALDRFSRARELYPAPSLSVMRARALRNLGRLLEALDAYDETQRTPLAEDAPEAFRQAVGDATREGAELQTRVPRLAVHVPAESWGTRGFSVLLDRKPVPAALVDVERPIDPGPHEVVVSAPNRGTVTRHVTLAETERVTLEIALDDPTRTTPKEPTPASPPPPADPPAEASTSHGSPWPWVALGVGVAGIGTSVVTGLMALDKKSTLDTLCQPGCPPDAADDIDAFRVNRTVSYVSFGIGAAALGVGGVLLLTGSSNREHAALVVAPAAVSVRGAF